MSAEVFEICVDIHEPEEIYEEIQILVSTNEKFMNFRVTQKEMPVGDYVCRDLYIERKEVADFFASIKDKRIFNQVVKLSQVAKHVFILVSGNPMYLGSTKAKAIFTTIADIELRYNIRIQILPNDTILAYYVTMLCYKLSQDLKPTWVISKFVHDSREEIINIVSQFYLIGRKSAKEILAKFENLKNFVNADEETLQSVKHIGKKRAKHLFDTFTRKYQPKQVKKQNA